MLLVILNVAVNNVCVDPRVYALMLITRGLYQSKTAHGWCILTQRRETLFPN